jgi:hypothetical protein
LAPVGGSRFLQTDPIPGGSANKYEYVNQDPVNGFDLGGTCWGRGCGAIIHAAKKAAHVTNLVVSNTYFQIGATALICAGTEGAGCVIANRAFAAYNSIGGCVHHSAGHCIGNAAINVVSAGVRTRGMTKYEREVGLGYRENGPAILRTDNRGGAYLRAAAHNVGVGGAVAVGGSLVHRALL